MAEHTKITIERDNIKLTLEHTDINQFNVDDMLAMFKALLQADTYVIDGEFEWVKEE